MLVDFINIYGECGLREIMSYILDALCHRIAVTSQVTYSLFICQTQKRGRPMRISSPDKSKDTFEKNFESIYEVHFLFMSGSPVYEDQVCQVFLFASNNIQ